MEFVPDKINREHVLKAVEHVKNNRIELIPSTQYDVLIDGEHYPPKDILRYAHELVNGEHLWQHTGGEPTNRYLRGMGFEITEKDNSGDPVAGMVQKYKEIIKVGGLKDEIFKWQAAKEFHHRPDTSAADFQKEINSINFSNLVFYNSLRVIKHLAEERPEEFRSAFKELFDESKNLLDRVNGFSEKTLEIYRSIENTKHHHHQDERTISVYLAYFDANKYPIFKDSFYRKYCKMIGIQHKSKGEKYFHYKALLEDFIDEYIIPDEELLELKAKLIPEDAFEDSSHYILAQDILYQVLDKSPDKARRYWRIGTSSGEKQYWDILHEQNLVSIGWPELGDLNDQQIGSKKDVRKLFEDLGLEVNKSVRSRKSGEVYNFYSELKPGDVVLAQDGMKIKGIGIVSDDYNFQEELAFPHTRAVDWKKVAAEIDLENKEGLNTTVFELKDPVLISKIDEILVDKPPKLGSTVHSLNTILYGPPGTGKTYFTINLALRIADPAFYEEHSEDREKLRARFNELLISDWDNPQKGRVSFCTFHQSFSYEDFVEGIKPAISKEDNDKNEEEEGRIRYKIHDGLFKRMVVRARNLSDADEKFVMIIDEISRGNVSQIFGELITLIEKDKRAGMKEALEVTLPYSKHKFSVPSNLYIIGTMNTADRSVEALDTALRRRFSFMEMMPDANLIASHGNTGNNNGLVEGISLVELLETMNERLSYLLDEDHQIGHSFFMNVKSADDLRMVFRDNIVPLLKEFFYNDFGKIRMVLGDKFVKKIDAGDAKPGFAATEDDDYILDKTVYKVVEIDDGFDIIDALKGIVI